MRRLFRVSFEGVGNVAYGRVTLRPEVNADETGDYVCPVAEPFINSM